MNIRAIKIILALTLSVAIGGNIFGQTRSANFQNGGQIGQGANLSNPNLGSFPKDVPEINANNGAIAIGIIVGVCLLALEKRTRHTKNLR